MRRKRLHALVAGTALLAIALAIFAGCRGLVASLPPTGDLEGKNAPHNPALAPIKHVVILMQENRSFDNYFGKLNDYRRAHGLPEDVDGLPPWAGNPNFDNTATIAPFHFTTVCSEALSPSWNESHVQMNRNDPTSPTKLMDGFVFTAAKYARDLGLKDTEGRRAMGYYTEREIPYYYYLATQFGISDRFFASLPSRTPPNRMYLLAGTSAGHTDEPKDAVTIPTIFHLLHDAGVSWRIYNADDSSGISPTLNRFQPFATLHGANVVGISQFFADAGSGNLPAVSFIDVGLETSGLDEHPPSNIQEGAAFAARVVNGLMQSPSWDRSVAFITWDEAGGFYDHVPPPEAPHPDGIQPHDLAPTDIPGDFDRYGIRVPLLVVSPFAKRGYVSHTVADFTAILKFVENRYGLPSLTQRDAAQPDLGEFFDFDAPPNLRPPAGPAQPTSAPCYHDRVP